MKNRIKKLFYSSFIAFISIAVNFDAEARLPKYMAQRAAELLIEKSGLQLKEGVEKEAFAEELVDFLYSTEKRQHLANWFRPAYRRDIQLSEASTDIKELFAKLSDITGDIHLNRQFVNERFPCWTGTLTCFMMPNSLAYNMLISNNLVQVTKASLHQGTNCEKVINLLFVLELVDRWDDIKGIVDKQEEPIPELFAPYDPYNCVPVPNTAYKITYQKAQGSCMISVIKNLLYILCRDSPNSTDIITKYMRTDLHDAFSDSIYTISGTTSFTTLRAFANAILPGVTSEYRPDLALFAYTLYGLLKDKISITALPTPKEYLNRIVPIELIKVILEKLSNHNIEVEINNTPTKLTRTWPERHLIISDTNVKKKITIAFGQCGGGTHMEIINIETLLK